MASFTVLDQEYFSNLVNRRNVRVEVSCATVKTEGGGVDLKEILIVACLSSTRGKNVLVTPDVAEWL